MSIDQSQTDQLPHGAGWGIRNPRNPSYKEGAEPLSQPSISRHIVYALKYAILLIAVCVVGSSLGSRTLITSLKSWGPKPLDEWAIWAAFHCLKLLLNVCNYVKTSLVKESLSTFCQQKYYIILWQNVNQSIYFLSFIFFFFFFFFLFFFFFGDQWGNWTILNEFCRLTPMPTLDIRPPRPPFKCFWTHWPIHHQRHAEVPRLC